LDELCVDWQARMIYQVGVWYYEHLAGQKPIGKQDDHIRT
jgi:hypothetical protein